MSTNPFSMLDLSDSEGEEAAAPVVAPKKASAKTSNQGKGNKKPATRTTGGSSAIASDPVAARTNNTKRNARSYDRNAGTRKREFDRKSGTGRDKSIKKGGAGARNWGKEGEGSEQTSAPIEAGEEGEAPAAEEVEEEPDNSMTYEEYTAMMKEKRSTSAAFKPLQARKVQNSFGKKKAVAKKVDEEEVAKGGPKRERARNTMEKKVPDVGFTAPPMGGRGGDRRDQGEQRGRGGYRGRGRGGFRGGRGGRGGPRVNIMDPRAFPTLG